MVIEIASLNVRGLGSAAKRREIFHYFNLKSFNVIFLQEMHCTRLSERFWKSEWGHAMYMAPGESDSRGTGILIKNNCPHEIHTILSDPQGWYIILDISFGDFRVTIANIYGPNKDDPEFFKQVFEFIENLPNDNRIIGGDFNVVLDNQRDKKGGNPDHSNCRSQQLIQDWITDTGLIDIWRYLNPEKEVYTWFKSKPYFVACRLDFFLLSEGLTSNVKETGISYGVSSDHSLVSLATV